MDGCDIGLQICKCVGTDMCWYVLFRLRVAVHQRTGKFVCTPLGSGGCIYVSMCVEYLCVHVGLWGGCACVCSWTPLETCVHTPLYKSTDMTHVCVCSCLCVCAYLGVGIGVHVCAPMRVCQSCCYNPGTAKPVPLPCPTVPVTSSQKAMMLLRHDLASVNSHELLPSPS